MHPTLIFLNKVFFIHLFNPKTMKHTLTHKLSATAAAVALFIGGFVPALAWSTTSDDTATTELQIAIIDEEKSIEIVDRADGSTVAAPTISMSSINFDFTEQTSTGTLGTETEAVRAYNPTVAPEWSVTIAATSGVTANWTDGASEAMDYNNPTLTGTTDGDGQLTVDPSGATVRNQAGTASPTGLSLGSSSAFLDADGDDVVEAGDVNSIALYSADGTAATYDFFDLTGVAISQLVPANQVVASYTLDMTLTIL